jgi:hypothetical protein
MHVKQKSHELPPEQKARIAVGIGMWRRKGRSGSCVTKKQQRRHLTVIGERSNDVLRMHKKGEGNRSPVEEGNKTKWRYAFLSLNHLQNT